MRLTKNRLINLVKDGLILFGYQHFADTLTGGQGLFVKKVKDDYFLTLGLEISRYYESMFSASYYLSKTTRWSSVWGDIPRECFERVGALLHQDERKEFLAEEYSKKNVIDAWWNADSEIAIQNFLKVVGVSENRLVENEELIAKIEDSKEVLELEQFALKTKNAVVKKDISIGLNFQPQKSIDGIPLIWFEAAETVLKSNGGILNNNTIKLLAADAWRQYNVK